MSNAPRLRLEIMQRFPFRGSRNVPNKKCMIMFGTRAELRDEIAALIAVDAFSYGTITRIELFDLEQFNADPLKAKAIESFATVDEVAQ